MEHCVSKSNWKTKRHGWQPPTEEASYSLHWERKLAMAIVSLKDTANLYHEQYFSLLDDIKQSINVKEVPTHTDITNIASVGFLQVKVGEYLKYLKTLDLCITTFRNLSLTASDSHCIINCDLNVLKEFHIVPEEMQKLGSKIIRSAYKTLDNCQNTKNTVSILLFLATEHIQEESFKHFFDLPNVENSLQRNILHVISIFIHQEHVLKCLPEELVEQHINGRDLHGCTPLHLAYLHHNEQAVSFLKSHGARDDILDDYGVPANFFKDLLSKEQPDVSYHQRCCDIMSTNSGVFQMMKQMLTFSEMDAENLGKELKLFFQHLIQNTEYASQVKDISLAGSLREKLKAGRLDKADVQIKFMRKIFDHRSVHRNLVMGLTKMPMQGMKLRPICTANPWEFIWEGPGPMHGLKISVDVAPMYEDDDTHDNKSFTKQGWILENPKIHKCMHFLNLRKVEDGFCPTYFAYEADIIDSLPTGARLGILIVKALLEAYYWHKDMHLSPRRKPITSYMVKTAVFHILSNRGYPAMVYTSAVESTCGDEGNKLIFKPSPRWMNDTDLETNAEEGRLWACKIINVLLNAGQDFGMKHYWADFGEISMKPIDSWNICSCLLDRLKIGTF